MPFRDALVAGCIGCLLVSSAAAAAGPAPAAGTAEGAGGWTFSVTPYLWGAGLSGTTEMSGLPAVDVDLDFRQIWDDLDFAGMVTGQARKARFSLLGDLFYVKLGTSASSTYTTLATEAKVTSRSFAGLAAAGYAIVDAPQGHLDLVVGAKVWSVSTTLSFSGGTLNGVSRSDSATWVDAMAGVKGQYAVAPKVYLTGWGLAGGGGASFDWDLVGGVGYRFNDGISAVLAYRAVGVDYRDDGFIYDTVQQGPILGVAFRF